MSHNSPQKPTIFDIVKSVVASVFGVQSAKNRERDFQQSSFVPYLVVGIIFVTLLVLTLVGLVALIV